LLEKGIIHKQLVRSVRVHQYYGTEWQGTAVTLYGDAEGDEFGRSVLVWLLQSAGLTTTAQVPDLMLGTYIFFSAMAHLGTKLVLALTAIVQVTSLAIQLSGEGDIVIVGAGFKTTRRNEH
jgi:hypothetical protein